MLKKNDETKENQEEMKNENQENIMEEQKLSDADKENNSENVSPTEELKMENLLLKDKYARVMAEFENFRKRNIKEREAWIKMATEKLVLEICEVLDNFERAIDTGVKEHQFDGFKKGIDLIFSQLSNVLKKEEVYKIDCLGKEFNPEFHEALSHMPSNDFAENKIAAIVQNGYMMNDKVIRPARVMVSSGKVKED